jgi:hypothetical protein
MSSVNTVDGSVKSSRVLEKQRIYDLVVKHLNEAKQRGASRAVIEMLELQRDQAWSALELEPSEPELDPPPPPPPPPGAASVPPPLPNSPDDWPDPINFFPGKLEAPPFDGTEAPAGLAEYPAFFAQHSGFDISGLLCAAVTSAAACIPDQIQICVNSATRWFAPPILWGLTIASSGVGKTPVQDAITRPLWGLHKELYENWKAQCDAQAEDDETKIPQPRVIVSDVTIEKMTDVLVENPRGAFYVTDEFSTLIGSMGQYKGGDNGADRGLWLKAYEGKPLQRERVGRGTTFVPHWGISILAATTAVQMEAYIDHLPADGLIQRFLITIGRPQQAVPTGLSAVAIERAEASYLTLMRRLWNLQPGAHNGVVQLSPGARALFDQWNADMQKLSTAFDVAETHAYASHLRKYAGFAARIALTYHCIETVSSATSPLIPDPAQRPVSASTMDLALKFLTRELAHAFAFYMKGASDSSGVKIAQAIAKYLVTRPAPKDGKLATRDLLSGCSVFNKAEEHTQGTALRLVEQFGWIRLMDTEIVAEGKVYKKLRPTQFRVNPKIAAKFAALAAEERERNATIVKHLAELKVRAPK